MREYNRDGKLVIHSTQLYEYFAQCPAAFKYSEKEIKPSDAMVRGLILEGELWGWKDKEKRKEYLARKRSNTLEQIEWEVRAVAPYFPPGGEPFKKIEYETDNYILVGEVDYYTKTMLYDLKRVSSHDYWDRKETVLDFLQGYYYPYIIYLATKKIIPFTYVVYATDIQLVKLYVIEHPESRFEDVQKLIDTVTNDLFFAEIPGEQCKHGTYGKCRYLYRCEAGRKYLTETKFIEV